ncbi:MAG: histidine kinase [Saprospiraceae bacterium]|nr:histidine kinase [Saprospiraceae bacterium]
MKEIIFQILVHIVVFVFYAFDRENPNIEAYKFANFFNYALTAAIINYIFLPLLYRKKNSFLFIALILGCVLASALAEEYIVEQMFFTGPRAETVKMLYAFLDIIPVVSILIGIKFGWDALNKQHEVDRLEKLVEESELQFLKSQINPHFLFNNLNNLYSYALEGSKKTPEIILELSGLLRYMLYECKSRFVDLAKEIKQLENFINLNTLQIEDRGKVTMQSGDIDGSFQIAPLIMIVFVENAFKHSQNSQSEKIEIDVDVDISKEGTLNFSCSNTFESEFADSNLDKGIGLENVRKRLNLIYPNKHTLTINKGEGTYAVNLTIDLNSSQ